MLLNMIAEAVFMSMMVSLVSARQMNRIINGKNATQGQFPYQVSWGFDYFESFEYIKLRVNFCGGSIIDKTTIITAAHCCESIETPKFTNFYNQPIDWSRTEIVAGEINLQETSGLEQVRKIKSHIIHPLYRLATKQNDICLLTLESPLRFDKYVGQIDVDNKKPEVGNNCEVSGWGYQVVGLR